LSGINAVILTGGVKMSSIIEKKIQIVDEITDKLKHRVATVGVD
jgi:hypothetical protein